MNVWQAGTHANANNSLTRDALQQTTVFDAETPLDRTALCT